MRRRAFGKRISARDAQFWNMYSLIVSSWLGSATRLSAVQPMNTPKSIVCTLSGIVISASAVQFSNAL